MLILLAHGSRDPDWRGSLETLARTVDSEMPAEDVRVAFMQFEGPTIQEVVGGAVDSGHKTLRLLPLFMASAGHVDKDIKPVVAGLARDHPGVDLVLLPPVGEDGLFPRLIVDIASALSGPS